ncbi:hypothetical protein Csa_014492 [Cucumis sativus]|uniref:Uncharacterized protein n=1 Tax=Cucumis sativus TaxID=3659 RepID=A0A0A0KZF8_CUCSA|nr:hypothetical protein Csa_014492 [Cucumis sativus]
MVSFGRIWAIFVDYLFDAPTPDLRCLNYWAFNFPNFESVKLKLSSSDIAPILPRTHLGLEIRSFPTIFEHGGLEASVHDHQLLITNPISIFTVLPLSSFPLEFLLRFQVSSLANQNSSEVYQL